MFGALALTVVSSDVESLRKGIIKKSRNEAQTPNTNLSGETGTGKFSIFKLIANTNIGDGIDPLPHNRVESVRKYEMSKFKATYVCPGDRTRRAC